MRKRLAFLFLLLPLCTVMPRNLHAQVTLGVATRVLGIRVPSGIGTAFTMDVDGRQYLITAKHVVAGLKQNDSVEITKDGQWSQIKVNIFRCDDPIDIAVLVPPNALTPTLVMDPISDSVNVALGQDVYFVGYPYGMFPMWYKSDAREGTYPIPLTKKGVLTAFDSEGKILLDGYNNPGFSGSPIVFIDLFHSGRTFYVLGVVSGYHPELVAVTKPVPIGPGENTSKVDAWRILHLQNGQTVELKDTDEVVPLNSGIVIGYNIKYAVDLIHKNPIGPKI